MNKVIVVAPHPDDETMGCGGTLLKHKARKDSIHWLVVTTASREAGYTQEQQQSQSRQIEKVAALYKFNSVHSLNFSTTRLDAIPMANIIAAMAAVFKKVRPEIVYLPYGADAHTDHKITSDAALACTKWFRHPYVKRVLAYEALSETDFGIRPEDAAFRPNVLVDISSQLEKKIQIMKVYSSELGTFPFPRSEKNIRALSALRGATAGAAAAEAFMLLKETI